MREQARDVRRLIEAYKRANASLSPLRGVHMLRLATEIRSRVAALTHQHAARPATGEREEEAMTTHDPAAPVAPEIERRVAEIMARPYRTVLTGDATDGFLATVPELPGCATAGETEAEALAMLRDAMETWLISVLERGLPVPEPSGLGGRGE